MRELNVFVAASTSLIAERDAVKKVLAQLNEAYASKNIRFIFNDWETLTKGLTTDATQQRYDTKLVRQSDIFCLIANHKLGDKTIGEFNVAYDHFLKHAEPYILFLLSEAEDESLKKFKTTLNEKLKHYYVRWNSINELELLLKDDLIKYVNEKVSVATSGPPDIKINHKYAENEKYYRRQGYEALETIRKKVKKECKAETGDDTETGAGISNNYEIIFRHSKTKLRDDKKIYAEGNPFPFLEDTEQLFILGEVGSGKTHTMYRFVLHLLQQDKYAAPVCLRLASWKAGKKFDTWLTESIAESYNIDKDVVEILIKSKVLFFCFDGLNEIDEKLTSEFLLLANELRKHGNKILITCNKEEFDELPKQYKHFENFIQFVQLNIQLLNTAQVKNILTQQIKDEASVKLIEKEGLINFINTPATLQLFLETLKQEDNHFIYTLINENEEDFLKILWEKRIERRFTDKFSEGITEQYRIDFNYQSAEIKRYMALLARNMNTNSFFIEDMQQPWLQNRTVEIIYVFLSRIIGCILVSFMLGLLLADVFGYIDMGILCGLITASVYLVQKREKRPKTEYWQLSIPKKILKSAWYIFIYGLFLAIPLYIFSGHTVSRLSADKTNFLGFTVYSTSGNVGLLFALFITTIIAMRSVWQSRFNDIRLVENRPVNSVNAFQFGLFIGLLSSIFISALTLLVKSKLPESTYSGWITASARLNLPIFWLITIVCFPITFALGCIMGWSKHTTLRLNTKQREGITGIVHLPGLHKTWKNSFFFSFIMLLIMAAYCCIILVMIFSTGGDGVYKGIRSAFGGAIYIFLWWGGLDILQYFMLRLILFLKGDMPLYIYNLMKDLERLGFVAQKGSHFYFKEDSQRLYLIQKHNTQAITTRKPLFIFGGVFIILLLAVVPYLNYIHPGLLNKAVWNNAVHAKFEFEINSSNVTKTNTNSFKINKPCTLIIAGTGKIKVGDFTGFVPVTGTEVTFMGMPIKDAFNKPCCMQTSHGAVIYKTSRDSAWKPLFPRKSNWLFQQNTGFYTETALLNLNAGETIFFEVNDKETENNTGNFILSLTTK